MTFEKSALSFSCLFCNPEKHRQQNQILLKSNNFYLFAGLGAILEGYIIIATNTCHVNDKKVNSISDLSPELIDELFFLRSIVSRYYRETYANEHEPGHPGISFEHGRAGTCMSYENENLHCYHPHLCCYPSLYNLGSGFRDNHKKEAAYLWDLIPAGEKKHARSIYDIKDIAGPVPYLFVEQCYLDIKKEYDIQFREHWAAKIYLLDSEHDLTIQFLRRKIAVLAQKPELWDWNTYPEMEKVRRLITDFNGWIRQKEDFYRVDLTGPIPVIDHTDAVRASTSAGYNAVADAFNKRWQGLLQYETIGKFIQYIPRSKDLDEPPKILDAGCGPGFYAKVFHSLGFDCYAIDNSDAMMVHAAEYLKNDAVLNHRGSIKKIKLLNTSPEKLPATLNHIFSAVWLSAVILHLPRIAIIPLLKKISDLLICGGILYLSFREDKGAEVRDEGRVFYYYTLDEMRSLITETNCFSILDIWDGQTTRGTIHRDNRVKKWKHLLLCNDRGEESL